MSMFGGSNPLGGNAFNSNNNMSGFWAGDPSQGIPGEWDHLQDNTSTTNNPSTLPVTTGEAGKPNPPFNPNAPAKSGPWTWDPVTRQWTKDGSSVGNPNDGRMKDEFGHLGLSGNPLSGQQQTSSGLGQQQQTTQVQQSPLQNLQNIVSETPQQDTSQQQQPAAQQPPEPFDVTVGTTIKNYHRNMNPHGREYQQRDINRKAAVARREYDPFMKGLTNAPGMSSDAGTDYRNLGHMAVRDTNAFDAIEDARFKYDLEDQAHKRTAQEAQFDEFRSLANLALEQEGLRDKLFYGLQGMSLDEQYRVLQERLAAMGLQYDMMGPLLSALLG